MAKLLIGLGVCLAAAWGQAPTAPVLNQRGAINAITLQPAPSGVAPGGLLQIAGINLGPAAGFTATTTPLPTSLGDPALEVRINNRLAPILSATPGLLVVQVPFETPIGPAQVIVRRERKTAGRPASLSQHPRRPSERKTKMASARPGK